MCNNSFHSQSLLWGAVSVIVSPVISAKMNSQILSFVLVNIMKSLGSRCIPFQVYTRFVAYLVMVRTLPACLLLGGGGMHYQVFHQGLGIGKIWPAVRMIFAHLVGSEERFSYKEVQLKKFCPPAKTSCPPVENLNKIALQYHRVTSLYLCGNEWKNDGMKLMD